MPRIAFDFHPDAAADLIIMQRRLGHETPGETLRDALRIMKALAIHHAEGFGEIVLRNTRNGAERHLILKVPTPAIVMPDGLA